MTDIIAVTYATHEQGFMKELMGSYERHGLKHMVLGLGDEWKGFGQKMEKVLGYVKTLDPITIVVLHDAFDVVFMAGEGEILDKYHKVCQSNGNKSLVVSAEEPFSGLYGLLFNCSFNECRNYANGHVVNSGLIIADASMLVTFLEMAKDFVDDQTAATKLYMDGTLPMHLDIGCDLFLNVQKRNMWSVGGEPNCDRFQIHKEDLRIVTDDGTRPIALQGPECTDLSGILNALGYPSASSVDNSSKLWFLIYQLKAFSKRPHVRRLSMMVLMGLIFLLVVCSLVFVGVRRLHLSYRGTMDT